MGSTQIDITQELLEYHKAHGGTGPGLGIGLDEFGVWSPEEAIPDAYNFSFSGQSTWNTGDPAERRQFRSQFMASFADAMLKMHERKGLTPGQFPDLKPFRLPHDMSVVDPPFGAADDETWFGEPMGLRHFWEDWRYNVSLLRTTNGDAAGQFEYTAADIQANADNLVASRWDNPEYGLQRGNEGSWRRMVQEFAFPFFPRGEYSTSHHMSSQVMFSDEGPGDIISRNWGDFTNPWNISGSARFGMNAQYFPPLVGWSANVFFASVRFNPMSLAHQQPTVRNIWSWHEDDVICGKVILSSQNPVIGLIDDLGIDLQISGIWLDMIPTGITGALAVNNLVEANLVPIGTIDKSGNHFELPLGNFVEAVSTDVVPGNVERHVGFMLHVPWGQTSLDVNGFDCDPDDCSKRHNLKLGAGGAGYTGLRIGSDAMPYQ